MPFDTPPSTRLSRVAPQEACFRTSTSGMPCLANRPFSAAMMSGAASVSAMKPIFAPFTSGSAVAAKAPDGKATRTALTRAAVAVVFSIVRRLTSPENIFFIRMFPLLGHLCG